MQEKQKVFIRVEQSGSAFFEDTYVMKVCECERFRIKIREDREGSADQVITPRHWEMVYSKPLFCWTALPYTWVMNEAESSL